MMLQKIKFILDDIPYYLFQVLNLFVPYVFLVILPGDLQNITLGQGAYSTYDSKLAYFFSVMAFSIFFLIAAGLASFLFKKNKKQGYIMAAMPCVIIFIISYVFEFFYS